jgi:hypothetical protein
MTLGNMRELGVRSFHVSCWNCHHQAVLSADRWRDDVAVPAFGLRMVCTRRGIVGADARPNWKEFYPGHFVDHGRFSGYAPATAVVQDGVVVVFDPNAPAGTPIPGMGPGNVSGSGMLPL